MMACSFFPPPLLIFATALLLFLSTTPHALSQSQKPTDTDALTIFRSRADAHGNLAANWSTPDACSGRWRGVGCSSAGRVTSLSLPSLDLRGPLDPLSHLDRLRLLDLQSNRLNGTLLPLLSSLHNLKLLYLSGNDLSGAIPAAVGSLTRLLRVDLSDNDLVGPIPLEFSNLTRLITLRLQNNLLSGTLPDFSTDLPRLLEFNASDNQLYGTVPDAMLAKFGPASLAGNAGLCGPTPPLPNCSFTPPHGALSSPPTTSQSVVPSNPSSMPGTGVGRLKGGRGIKEVLGRGAFIGIAVGNAVFLLVLLSLLLAYCCCNRHLGLATGSGKVDEEEEGGGGDGRRSSGDSYSPEQGNKKQMKNRGAQGGIRTSDESEGGGGGGGVTHNKLVFFEKELGDSDGGGGRSRRQLLQRRRFELDELLRASAEMVGKGSLGTVYRAVLEDGRMVAVKRLRDANPCSRKEFHKYMELVGRLTHPNLVPLRAYYFANQEKLLIYDFLPNGSLHFLLHGNRAPGRSPLDWTTRISLVLGAARGLACIHQEYSSSGIPHGNIRSSNVLLDNNGAACVSDFGLALLLSPAHATASARLGGYRAPEQAEGLSQEADVYAFGVLLLEVLTGRSPSSPPPPNKGAVGLNLPEWVRSVVREEWTAEVFDPELMRYKNVEEEMVTMLHVGLACVSQQPDRRPTMSAVVKMIEDIRVEQSPLPEDEEDNDASSLSPSLAATNEDGRLSC